MKSVIQTHNKLAPARTRAGATRRNFGKSLLAGGSMALSSAAGLSAQGREPLQPLPGSPKLAIDHLSIEILTDDPEVLEGYGCGNDGCHRGWPRFGGKQV